MIYLNKKAFLNMITKNHKNVTITLYELHTPKYEDRNPYIHDFYKLENLLKKLCIALNTTNL